MLQQPWIHISKESQKTHNECEILHKMSSSLSEKKLGQNNGEAIQRTASEFWFGQYPIHTLKTWFDKKGMQMKML